LFAGFSVNAHLRFLQYPQDLVVGLLEALNDKNSDVQESISVSLVDLGKKRPDFILNIAKTFVNKNLTKVKNIRNHHQYRSTFFYACSLKLIESQRVYILNTLQKIIKEKLDDLEEQTAHQLTEHALNEMIHQKVCAVRQ
jgi:hypothetical protein